MPDDRAAAAIFARVGDDWSIFDRLAAHSEAERRRILRSHREVGFTSEGDADPIRLRRVLDDALDRLMLLELGIETGVVEESSLPQLESLRSLLASSACARYVNAYLNLGVRFVASRILGPAGFLVTSQDRGEINELPLALPCPPDIDPRRAEEAGQARPRFTARCSGRLRPR